MKYLKIIIIFLLFYYLILSGKIEAEKRELYDWTFIIINNKVITFYDLKSDYLKLKNSLLKYGQPIPPDLKTMIFNKLINKIIIEEVAEKKEVFVSDNEIDERIKNIKAMNKLSDRAFREALKREGKTLRELREEIRAQILTEKIMNLEVRGNLEEPTEEEIREYYEAHKKEMVSPEKVKVSHILIMDNPNASLKERSAKKKKAEMILKKALSGKNFAKLAEKYSEDEVSAKVGGNIGYIGKGEWLPEIDKFIFSLKKGEIYPHLLRSRWGWHIVKITDKKRKRHIPYKEIREKLKNLLFSQKMQQKFQDWLNEQRNNVFLRVEFPDDTIYVYSYNKWKNVKTNKYISNDEIKIKINNLNL